MIDKLLDWKNETDRKPLILKGVRQVGKTYLLQEFGKQSFSRCHYINFEKSPRLSKIFEQDLVPERILDELSFYLNCSIDTANDFLIFDEIQEAPKALTSLKYFHEECPKLAICGAGSLLGIHLNSGSFPVGKVTFLTLRPMCFEEFLMANEDEKSLQILRNLHIGSSIPSIVHEHLWNELKKYFVIGGLPEVVSCYLKNKEDLFLALSEVRKKQSDLINGYYVDIAKHSGKVNAMHIDRILNSIPSQMQQTQDGSIARFKFRGVVPGISHYDRLAGAIDWLEHAGLLIKVPVINTGHFPFKGFIKENFFKLLLFDIGILGSMAQLSPKTILDYEYGTYKGYFAENFVAEEFLSSGKESLFSWQEKNTEVEFLIELDGEVVPVEVKSGFVTHAKSLEKFVEKYNPGSRIMLSGKPYSINKSSKTHYIPLYLAGKFSLFTFP
jgi:predicted AAA+ superfamily ATPase